jgi:hypothetical protein
VTLASVAVGLVMAVLYYYSSARMQWRLSHQPSRVAAVLSVAALLVRLSGVGLVIVLLSRFTSLDIVVTATSFVFLFTVLSGVALWRFGTGRGPLGTSAQQHR